MVYTVLTARISIHASREGSDLLQVVQVDVAVAFLSTHPVRGATGQSLHFGLARIISIHASREGSDIALLLLQGAQNISIHASREGSDYNRGPHSSRGFHFYPRIP